jgi:cyclophilin family peptidyl-prolyl cis-trans isomerase
MAQGGDPTGSGSGGPGYHIACECYRDDARHHFRGTLSMAHAGRDTGGSQFFLTFVRTSHLDGKHTAFGRVIEGLDVLSHIQRVDPQQPSGVQPDEIVKATVVRKRDHEYQPKTLPATR